MLRMTFDRNHSTVAVRFWPLRAHLLSTASGWTRHLTMDVRPLSDGMLAVPRRSQGLTKRDLNFNPDLNIDFREQGLGPRYRIVGSDKEPMRAFLPEVTCLDCHARGSINLFLHLEFDFVNGVDNAIKQGEKAIH